jgi:hypothetical protein
LREIDEAKLALAVALMARRLVEARQLQSQVNPEPGPSSERELA